MPTDTVLKFYELISFVPGGAPRWIEMEALFHPGAVIVPPMSDTDGVSTAFTFPNFVLHFQPQFDKLRDEGFVEREVFESTSVFGAVAQRVSAYEISSGVTTIPFRGVNMFHLVRPAETWLISSLIWDRRMPDMPHPKTDNQPK